ncbi:putative disease resistance protein At4g19050 [Cynara cardunculus var. scolymus]|uniref:putative disease resistance protein At4g19050 n=1 Tax=Cynara cardunculus var. scolymus TaxID=59895 RepID=UPI000D626670|nr:putative disease resistance protein At4g19050 [Cynara cardunculus var. scolymus]
MGSAQEVKEIIATLERSKQATLVGPPGVGKTWMARRLSDRIARRNFYDFTLWMFMCRYYNRKSLSESIARQLCLLPTTQEWEVEDDSKGQKDDDVVEDLESLIIKLRTKLEVGKFLLILDDFPDDTYDKNKNENIKNFWSVWKDLFPANGYDEKLHILSISRLSRKDEATIKEKADVVVLHSVETDSLLTEKLDTQLRQYKRIRALGKKFIEKSNSLPGTVTMIAKALNYIGLEASGISILEKELEEASENYRVNRLLCLKHDMLPISVLKDLWWCGDHFFRDSGSVHYNELITYWILEGYLGFDSMMKLYEKGHGILMELMDCGILKAHEGGYVYMDKSLINVDDLYQCVDQIANLGLATVFTSDLGGFGIIKHDDGMLKTPRKGKKWHNKEQKQSLEETGQNLSTLLLDGTNFSEQVMTRFLEPEKELKVLALFNPNIKSLPKALVNMKLRVLVLRGCEHLLDVKLHLNTLHVLEISGARSLKTLKSSFFKNMENLQSLNLSGLQIANLPHAIYGLTKLKWLVVKDCGRLKKLESIAKLEDLKVLDLSGNIVLDSVDKNFLKFNKLQSLNLSNTMISTTPLLKQIKELTHLFLRDCKNLGRLRGLTSVTSLQTLDLSGSTDFEEFHESSLKSLVSLRTLNLTETAIESLPSNIANPRYLYLKSCRLLERLSCFESLVDLEVLDLSGSEKLYEIQKDFFNHMTHLRVLNLSETNVDDLPSLSNLSNLRELLLSRCAALVHLPSLESVTKLEVLDVSECRALKDIGDDSFKNMTRLQRLDLSETKIKSLPSLSNLTNLRYLLLKNCTNLQNLELKDSLFNLEELNLSGITSLKPYGSDFIKDMSNLQILDLSCTPVKQLPSMAKLTNLIRLSLANCSCLETLPDLVPLSKLEVLDLSQSSVKHLPNFNNSNKLRELLLGDCSIGVLDLEFNDLFEPNPKIPHWISELSHLDYLRFPNLKNIQGVDSSHVECSSEEVMNQDRWKICLLSHIGKPPIFLSGTQFLQILKKNPLPQGSFLLCAIPFKNEGETGDRYIQRHELVFRDVYFQTCQFARYERNKSLQIRGFKHIPEGIKNIISQFSLIFLIDNTFESLPSGLDAFVLDELKGCWIERCDKMVTIFSEEEGKEDPHLGITLEDLGISNNSGLESIYKGKQPFRSFNNLKTLYLDNCPKLSTVFPSSWLPETLKVLHIKHCDKIVSLFEAEGKLPQSLETLKIWECPKITQIEEIFKFAKDLKTLWICGATTLKSLYSGNNECNNFINLEFLKLESCPMLKTVMPSWSPLGKITSIKIRSCEKLQILFTRGNSTGYELKCVNTLLLEDLPMLEYIGAMIPSSKNVGIFGCPKYEGMIDTRTVYD